MENNQIQNSPNRFSGPIGRLLRFLSGIGIIIFITPYLLKVSMISLFIIVGITVGIVILYLLFHLAISNLVSHLNPWLGAVIAWAPVALIFLLGGGYGQLGVLLFVGLSLVLAGIRGDSGCEVMTIPGLFSRKHTHLICIVFSPLDFAESKLFRKKGT